MATTRVKVDPSGTIPLTGGAHGPFPCWISIQQSTLSPKTFKSYKLNSIELRSILCTSKIQLNNIQVSDNHWRFWSSFLIVIEPLASQPFSLIPNFQQIFVILHHNRIFIELSVQIWFCAATSISNAEREERLAGRRRNVHASWITVLT